MKSYLNLLRNVFEKGIQKPSGRPNMPDVLGLTHGTIEMDLCEGFPLLTTKKMFYRGIIEELLWFLRGETNIKSLVDKKCNFWNKDAYGYYLKHFKLGIPGETIICDHNREPISIDRFIELIKDKPLSELKFDNYTLGDLGPVYGHQWRNQDGVDQLKIVYDSLISNPYGRYKIIDAWNQRDFSAMALPPCHILYQFLVEPISRKERVRLYAEKCDYPIDVIEPMLTDKELDDLLVPRYYLDLNMYQRSCDMVLGVPFNIASMAFFLTIMAKAVGMIPRFCFWIGGHCDIYMEHSEAVKTQLSRTPINLPKLEITKHLNSFQDILDLQASDFVITDYNPAPKIEAELFTGLSK